MSDNKVALIHISSFERDVDRAIALAHRLIDQDLSLRVRLIVNGAALPALLGTKPVLICDRITVEACLFGLTAGGHDPQQLRPNVITVPQAATALLEGQFAGGAYLRL